MYIVASHDTFDHIGWWAALDGTDLRSYGSVPASVEALYASTTMLKR